MNRRGIIWRQTEAIPIARPSRALCDLTPITCMPTKEVGKIQEEYGDKFHEERNEK